MPNFTSSDLRDPQPPLPGERERALVATRAHELGRRRRLVQGGGALALVAAVAVSVAALTAGGASGPGGTNRVEAASGSDTSVSTPVSHVTAAPTTVAPDARTGRRARARGHTRHRLPRRTLRWPRRRTSRRSQPEVPSTFTLSGTVTGNPAGTTVTLTLNGTAAITVDVDGAGNYSVSGLAAGDYSVIGTWTDSTGIATGASGSAP